MLKKNLNYFVGMLIFVFGILLGGLGINVYNYTTTPQVVRDMNYLIKTLRNYGYYYENDEKLYEGALKGIVESLNDPYSEFFNEEDFNQFYSQISSEFAGLGVMMTFAGKYPMIIDVLDDTPASKAGLLPGDAIVSVDGIDVTTKTYEEIYDLIKGETNTIKNFIIARGSIANLLSKEVKLEVIKSPTVNSRVIKKNDKTIGYLSILVFSTKTYDEFLEEMAKLEDAKIDSLIVDVRSNPGGLLDCVTNVLDYFLNSKEPFSYQKTKDGTIYSNYLKKNNKEINYDITVLMNEHSASASEVFASTMSEVGGYTLIGKTSFGKGTVQVTIPLNVFNTRFVKLTTEIWLTSKKEWIHHVGIKPTIEVDLVKKANIVFIDINDDISYDKVSKSIQDTQTLLKKLGYDVRDDGYFDMKTMNAVKDFQIKNDLEVTGNVDSETAFKMNLFLLKYINSIDNDEQIQAAINYLLNK